MAISAQTFAGNVASKLGELARATEDLETLFEIYQARGAAGTFTDAALTDTGFTANQLETIATLRTDLRTFLDAAGRWEAIQRHRGDL